MMAVSSNIEWTEATWNPIRGAPFCRRLHELLRHEDGVSLGLLRSTDKVAKFWINASKQRTAS